MLSKTHEPYLQIACLLRWLTCCQDYSSSQQALSVAVSTLLVYVCVQCYLGDAFRCGSCPYRGLPAFEKGKKIQLAADFLTADA